MAPSNEAKQDLIPHITFPIPDLKHVPKNLSQEERLETIIANLDHHHQATRLKLIEDAKKRVQEHHASNEGGEDGDRMDVSPSLTGSDGMETFLSNLNTPYSPAMGDLSCSPPTAHLLEGMSVGVPQKTPPIELQIAKDTLDRIALYDAHALPARKYYTDALAKRKERSIGSTAATDPRRSSTGGGSIGDPRRQSASGPVSAPPSRAGSSSFVPAGRVDPRLVHRPGRGSAQDASRSHDPRLRGS